MEPLRVALVGYGLAGAVFHGPLVAAEPRMRVAAVVTSDGGRAAAARAAHPGVRVVPGVEDLWRHADDLDVVVVASPNSAHVPVAAAALAAGLHVVVDKPLAVSAAEGRGLADAARAAGRLLTVFHNRRWDGDFLTLRRLVRAGAVGPVTRLESRFERWRPVVDAARWRESPDPAEGGGVLLDLGSHLVDQALVLLGPAVAVTAEVAARRPGARVDDDAFVALRHAGGAVSHLWMSLTAPGDAPRFLLRGLGGAFTTRGLDGQEDALRAGRRPGPGWGAEPPGAWGTLVSPGGARRVRTEPGAWQRFYSGVAAAVLDGAPPPVPVGDAVRVLEVLDAARRSAATGEVVALST